MTELVSAEHHKTVQGFMNTEDIVYGYCTEIMVKLEPEKLQRHPFSEENFRNDLSHFGDSLLVISDDELVKVHVHSETPGEVLSYGQKYGSLIKIKIENMREQHSSIVDHTHNTLNTSQPSKEKLEFGIVTVSMGEGIAQVFKSIGASSVIEGGQTMNPSTEDLLKSIKEANANKVFILPNNKNIIMAAEQAAEVADEEVIVIPSKTVPQGMAALLAFNPSLSLEENKTSMTQALQHVKSGQITYAVRDTSIDGKTINKNDFMGILEGKIVETNQDLFLAAKGLLQQMLDEEAEILTIMYGEDVEEEQLNELVSFIHENYEDIEVEVHNGKQPIYSYIFAVE